MAERSSIPIPDDAVEAVKVSLLHFSHACERRGYGLLVCGGCGETLNSYEDGAADENIARDAVTAAAPKLYAHWAEVLRGKLDELRLHDDTGDPRDDGYMACLADVLAALGLEDRT